MARKAPQKVNFYKETVKRIEVHKATRCIIRHDLMLLWFKDLRNEVTTSNTPDENHDVKEPIKRILNSHNVYVAQKPFQIWGIFYCQT